MATGLNTNLVEIGGIKSGNTTVIQQGSSIVYGHVLDVITDSTSKYYVDASSIGCIRFKNLHDMGTDEDSVNTIAYPIDRSDYTLPLPGEQVIIIPAYGPNVESLYTARYYYSSIVSTKNNVNDNIIPFLGTTGNKSSNLEKLKNQLKDAFGPVAANRFISKIKHDQKTLQQKTIQEQPSEGDKIIQGRYGGVIKFTSTIENDNEQHKVFPTAGSPDGDPLLIIKNNRRAVADSIQYERDNPNIEDVVTYYTTSQKIPITLGCSKNLLTWNPDKVAGIQATKFAIASLNKEIDVKYKVLPLDIIDSTVGSTSPINVEGLTGKDKFVAVTSLVIALLEGGYYNPAWHNSGDARYSTSGETMYGIDRKQGGTINTSPAGVRFWKIIDENKEKNGRWAWFYMPGDPLKSQLLPLASEAMYPQYTNNMANFGSQALIDAINEDERLLFHFIYACWNGPGWFQKFASDITAYLGSGKHTKDEILARALSSRTDEGYTKGSPPNSLIRQGGLKIKGFINDIFVKSTT